jgi:prepilin-type N-terminal cleavage/methylation domain-containing protein
MKNRLPHLHPRRSRRAFTFVELMASLIIFALIATASTYLLGASAKTQSFVQGDATTESEVGFALQRITENVRAATAVTPGTSSLTITSPPTTISGTTYNFTITYNLVGSNLWENYTNNANGSSYSSGIIVHNVQAFTPISLPANNKALQITLKAGTPSTTIARTFVAFGRNL